MTVQEWLQAGVLDLPLPGSGATAQRWRRLAELAEQDLVAARLAEAHCDAVAILHELGGKPPAPHELWGVWAAEAPDAVVTAEDDVLNGVKAWCSGAGLCTHALVTTQGGLYAVAVADAAPQPGNWVNVGMSGSDTRAVRFQDTKAVYVGEYLDRPGFWHGAIGVAACWLGGARSVAAPLYRKARDEHALAHLGAVDAALAAADSMLEAAAAQIDADPLGDAERLARRVRAVVEDAVDQAITRTGRALGPAPLCTDAAHAQRVADLGVYVRQSHAERDLAALGRLVRSS
ncbi:acyl-CoA dehydrogenase [Mycobacterium sp. MS1601]|uniref:acyl-CoA dehydrogenase n=1 Tax=Mycobacterium sp. MS1601 TaxID=1936029 RepID=UPI000979330A|nr:acyl-CoA dehydrogenase [Mycobacterium sp. MS1601]AQA01931.1 acyl-CoA dehydrogenase [Mycobacterium sp. MS1601]